MTESTPEESPQAASILSEARRRLAAGDTAAVLLELEARAGHEATDALLRDWWLAEARPDRAGPVLERLVGADSAEGWAARSAQALLAGDPGRAVEAARQAIRRDADCAAAYGHLGRALFNAGRMADAERCFAEAVRRDPDSAVARYNQGHLLRAAGRLDAAVAAYGEALARAPGLRAARFHRGITHSLAERPGAALADFQALLEADAADLEARLNAGLARQTLGDLDAAEADYRAVLERAPDHPLAWTYLGILCNEQLRTAEAVEALERALALDPNELDARRELANVFEKANRLDQAEAALAPALPAAAEHPGVVVDAARLKRRRGDAAGALALLDRIDPRGLPERLALEVQFERANALDRAGRYDEALSAVRDANRRAASGARRARIDRAAFPREVAGVRDWLAAGAPGIDSRGADSGAELCFMIGFPRCGTTLLDTILNAAEGLATLDERPTFERARAALEPNGQPYWSRRRPFPAADADAFRAAYRKAVADELGDRPTDRVVDKLPLRVLHAPLLAQAFPAAKFVVSLRHPADVVLSNLMQHYVPNDAYVHFDTLDDTVATYLDVMQLWAAIRPLLEGRLHLVRYEDLVDDPEAEVARACAFLGIDFDPAMLDPATRLAGRERVRTNSYEQVAESIYRRSAGRWRNYRDALMPYRDRLQPVLDEYGYSME
ncbi:tetratricopeptide repeat protein [Wenzhouxiangella sp. XN79A]|uniref:tetratricopeptide repeat-containing sulfotransferase family protein n=1 Tax=Wenzhouxiangella sp. XN79A TaxID=2724193 RepID=UPI00144AB7FC|nr:tetratricopeptide repeat-containing sulfotransferase family protein [Wenzhouxiangella sp. XN79A]NKI34082.1 tetratricopeptide repeat protein [Wenzhouxiangella sp. XN79A]